MAMMSSNELAAIIVVGIPLDTPSPFFYRIIIEGTSTAGLTAASTNPMLSAKAHGILNIAIAIPMTVPASTIYGPIDSNRTVSPLPANSSSIAPRNKIRERQIDLTLPARISG